MGLTAIIIIMGILGIVGAILLLKKEAKKVPPPINAPDPVVEQKLMYGGGAITMESNEPNNRHITILGNGSIKFGSNVSGDISNATKYTNILKDIENDRYEINWELLSGEELTVRPDKAGHSIPVKKDSKHYFLASVNGESSIKITIHDIKAANAQSRVYNFR